MKTKILHWVLLGMFSAVALGACGGGGGGGGGSFPVGSGGTGSGAGTTDGSTLPSSATSNVDSFIAYMKQLVATKSDVSEPLNLGDAVAPVSDSAEPTLL